MAENHVDKELSTTNYCPLIIASIAVIFVFLFSWFLLDYSINVSEKRGQFGDQFGVVNAFFTGLAFAGLIYTIILQKKSRQKSKGDKSLGQGESHSEQGGITVEKP